MSRFALAPALRARLSRAAVAVRAGTLGTVVVGVALACGCGRPCRRIDVTPLPLACASTSSFFGELHFDDAATFESFLEIECLPDAEDAVVKDIVDSVDFTVDAVFVAVGDRAQTGRCIGERESDGVDVCEDGLRVGFSDVLRDEAACSGKWTVAFSLPRAELRAALDTPSSTGF